MQVRILGSDSKPEIEIYEGAEKVIHTKIDSEVSAFRITCLNVKRVFSVYEEVVKKHTSTILLNEYSQPLGKIERDRLLVQTGMVEVEDLQMNYRIRTTENQTQLFFTRQSTEVFSCVLHAETFASLNETNISILLFSLCWYAHLAKKAKEVPSLV
ncbi:MAG: hypothetical protein ABIR81_09880 [Ginsengibacter sp.]